MCKIPGMDFNYAYSDTGEIDVFEFQLDTNNNIVAEKPLDD